MRPYLHLLPFALVLAACGGDGGGTTPEPPPQPTFRAAPETAPREITLGTAIQGEHMNTGGDVDDFGFTAPPGGVVAVVVTAQTGGQTLSFAVVDSATDAQVAGGLAYGAAEFNEIVRADVSPGRWLLRVRLDASTVTGPYTLIVHAVNPHPEQGDSVLASGAWTHAEGMEPHYDVDDFVFDGIAGQDVNVFGQLVAGGKGLYKMRLRGAGPVRGAWTVEKAVEGHRAGATGVVRLPATGRYRVRMMAEPAFPAALAGGCAGSPGDRVHVVPRPGKRDVHGAGHGHVPRGRMAGQRRGAAAGNRAGGRVRGRIPVFRAARALTAGTSGRGMICCAR